MRPDDLIRRALEPVDRVLDELLETPEGALWGLAWLALSVLPPLAWLFFGWDLVGLWPIVTGINVGLLAGAAATAHGPSRVPVASSLMITYHALAVLATLALFDGRLGWVYGFLPDPSSPAGGFAWGACIGVGLACVARLARADRTLFGAPRRTR